MTRLPSNVKQWLMPGFISFLATVLFSSPTLAHPGHDVRLPLPIAQHLTPGLMLTGLGVAFLVGSSHALSPGHGKTMVAAYLVGSRGTIRHAFLLGMITTLTHTLGVFGLGLLMLVASRYIVPEQLYPILSFMSGITVSSVGFWLLLNRLHSSKQVHHHSHEHHHEHSHSEDHHHEHHHLPPDAVTMRSLITLGIAGGMIPCPSALVLLFSAIALHQTTYGLLLVTAFSLGLATVLIAIGILVVHAQYWLDRSIHRVQDHFPIGHQVLRFIPIVSAIVVIIVGAVLSASAISAPP
jgi:nickel/cobalt transporter (NicO) family protein